MKNSWWNSSLNYLFIVEKEQKVYESIIIKLFIMYDWYIYKEGKEKEGK